MLVKTVTYTDYNDEVQTEDLYFNLTRTELTDMIRLEPKYTAWAKKVDKPNYVMSTDEKLEILEMIKELIRMSYGVRTEDGKRFIKNKEVLDAFEQSAVYDEFVFSLFTDGGDAAGEFMSGIMPKGIVDAAATENVELPQSTAPEKPKRPQDMTHEELVAAYQARNSQE